MVIQSVFLTLLLCSTLDARIVPEWTSCGGNLATIDESRVGGGGLGMTATVERVFPTAFNLDDSGADDRLIITLQFSAGSAIPDPAALLCALFSRQFNGSICHPLASAPSSSRERIELTQSRAAILQHHSGYGGIGMFNNNNEFRLLMRCRIGASDHLSLPKPGVPAMSQEGVELLFTRFSKLTHIFNASTTSFHANDHERSVTAFFANALPIEIENSSSCIIDDQELPAQSTNDTHVVICDFSQVTTINESNESKERDERQRSNNSEIRVSTIYVVRSPQLADATRHFQTPLQIGVSNAVGVSQVGAAGIQQGQGGSNTVSSVIDDFVPIDADQRNQFVVVRFTNDLNSLEFYVDKEGEKKGSDGVNSMKNETAESTFAAKLNLSQEERKTNFSCAHFIDKSSIQLLGDDPQCCLIENGNSSFVHVELGENAHVNFYDRLWLTNFNVSDIPSSNASESAATVNAIHRRHKYEIVVKRALQPIIPRMTLHASREFLGCDEDDDSDEFLFWIEAISGHGRRNFTCKWSVNGSASEELQHYVETTRNCSLSILARHFAFLRKRIGESVSVSSYACNFALNCAKSETLSVSLLDNFTNFDVEIYGVPLSVSLPHHPETHSGSPPTAFVVAATRLMLSAHPMLMICASTRRAATMSLFLNDVVYTWMINGSDVSHNSVYSIAPFTYGCGDEIVVELFADLNPTDLDDNPRGISYSATEVQRVQYVCRPIVAAVDGVTRAVAVNEPLRIDASASWTRNSAAGNALEHSWRCLNLTTAPVVANSSGNVSENSECAFDAVLVGMPANGTLPGENHNRWKNVSSLSPNAVNWTDAVLQIPPNSLLPISGVFCFVDTITDGSADSSSTSTIEIRVIVHVRPPNVPAVHVTPSNVGKRLLKITDNSFVRFNAFIRSKIGNLYVYWQLFRRPDNTSVDMSSLSGMPPTQRNFTQTETSSVDRVAIDRLSHSKDHRRCYALRLNAVNSVGAAFTDYEFCVQHSPQMTQIHVEPTGSVTALETVVRVRPQFVSSGAPDSQAVFRFGVRTHLVGNRSRRVFWTRRSAATAVYETVLPSAWQVPHAACGERVALQVLVEMCIDGDWSACVVTESAPFSVANPLQPQAAAEGVLTTVRSTLANGDVIRALELLDALRKERCNETIDAAFADQLVNKLLAESILSNQLSSESMIEGLDYAMRIVEFASPKKIDQIVELAHRVRETMSVKRRRTHPRLTSFVAQEFLSNDQPKSVLKRDASSSRNLAFEDETSNELPEINDDAASTLLAAYDLLVSKRQDVARVYLYNIEEIVSAFCLDANGMRPRHASGAIYTDVEAQQIVPGDPDFLNRTFTVAGVRYPIVGFDAGFASTFTSWRCGDDGNVSCAELCLGTARTSANALHDNVSLRGRFFSSQFSNVQLSKSVSDFYYLFIVDPFTGTSQNFTFGAQIIVDVPLSKYAPSDYYKCFVFGGMRGGTPSTTGWEENACTSADYASILAASDGSTVDGTTTGEKRQFHLRCRCTKPGVLAVFAISPPPPPYYPPYNEIQLTYHLDTDRVCDESQLRTFIERLTSATGISTSRRFVRVQCALDMTGSDRGTAAIVYATLRPPFCVGQLSNSYAMQSIKRTVKMSGGFIAYETVRVRNVTDVVLHRKLNGDGNARRITFRIDRSFKEVIGTSADAIQIALRWTHDLAEAMRISPYRFKNPSIVIGIVFNVTITLPFSGEAAVMRGGDAHVRNEPVLSAEEIAAWIVEQVFYDEIEFRDRNHQTLPIDGPLDATTDVVELRVQLTFSASTTIVLAVLSVSCVTVVAAIIVMVLVKWRTDRLIEAHNANMRTVDIGGEFVGTAAEFGGSSGAATISGGGTEADAIPPPPYNSGDNKAAGVESLRHPRNGKRPRRHRKRNNDESSTTVKSAEAAGPTITVNTFRYRKPSSVMTHASSKSRHGEFVGNTHHTDTVVFRHHVVD